MTKNFFIPCFIDSLYPQVGMSVVEILELLGLRIVTKAAETCCGFGGELASI